MRPKASFYESFKYLWPVHKYVPFPGNFPWKWGITMADDKNKTVYGILAILLGGLGIHKFYVGDTKNGIIYLILGVCTFGSVGGILGIITGIMALTKSDEDFYKDYVEDQKFL